jgi:multidrug efflux pump subunit AcrB
VSGQGYSYPELKTFVIRAVVAWCVRRRRTVVALTFAASVASIASFALIPKQLFPDLQPARNPVDLWLPEGASFAETERDAKRLELRLLKDPDLAYVVSFIGEGAPALLSSTRSAAQEPELRPAALDVDVD